MHHLGRISISWDAVWWAKWSYLAKFLLAIPILMGCATLAVRFPSARLQLVMCGRALNGSNNTAATPITHACIVHEHGNGPMGHTRVGRAQVSCSTRGHSAHAQGSMAAGQEGEASGRSCRGL
jgi:hypothetical protein